MPVSPDQYDQQGKALKCVDCGAPLSFDLQCERCVPPSSSSPQLSESALPVVRRNWRATLIWGALFLAAAFGSISALPGDASGDYTKTFWLAILALVFLVISVGFRHSYCPHCSAKLDMVTSVQQCRACKNFFVVRGDRLHPIGKGFIAGYTCFNVQLNTLRPPTKWTFPWRGQCAVCRAPATREEIVRVFVPADLSKPVHVTRTTSVWDIPVDHCDRHIKGIKFDGDHCSGPQLKFRALDHWRDFSAANHA
jgi:hypothetical protein